MSNERPSLPPDRLWQPTTARWFAVVFGAALCYAIARYHLAGDVEWRHFPLFILNKATSLAAVVFVACSYLVGKIIRWHDDDRALRLVVIKFCGMGELAVAVGVVALFLLMSPAITTLPMMPKALGGQRWKRGQRLGYAALILVVVHLVVLGWKGWLAPNGWHAGLPPISLVAVVAALVPLLVKRKLMHRKRDQKNERSDE